VSVTEADYEEENAAYKVYTRHLSDCEDPRCCGTAPDLPNGDADDLCEEAQRLKILWLEPAKRNAQKKRAALKPDMRACSCCGVLVKDLNAGAKHDHGCMNVEDE
jgi:hypothetical protein